MTDYFQGDPKLFLGPDGSYLEFNGGQPVMDQGLENLVLISLFSGKGWVGNYLFNDPKQKIGSDFETAVNQTITLNSLNRVRLAAKQALNDPAFGNVEVSVSNPTGYRIDITIQIKPPGQNVKELLLTKNGLNWFFQITNPASMR